MAEQLGDGVYVRSEREQHRGKGMPAGVEVHVLGNPGIFRPLLYNRQYARLARAK